MIAFGPIPPRRLGLSLVINNIVSNKVCSYSCVYCQISVTLKKLATRQVFYEPEKLVENVGKHLEKLDNTHKPDYLTFVANGEPTIDINLGKEIRLLKKSDIPIAVITNSSLIHLDEVRSDLMEADWVSVKVDAVDEAIWRKINRPPVEMDLNKILDGLQLFAVNYQGKLHTETMLVEGYNDSTKLLKQSAFFIAMLKTQKAYLSIPTRPPALKEIKVVSEEKLTEAWRIFQKNRLKSELLTGFEGTNAGFTGNAFEDILNITAVHPLREDTVVRLLKENRTDHSVVDSGSSRTD